MHAILFGVALGQLLAVAILIGLELLLALVFWRAFAMVWEWVAYRARFVWGRFMPIHARRTGRC